MEQPAIELLGVTVLEPVTTGTDILASAVCFFAFFRLTRLSLRDPHSNAAIARSVRFVRYYFLLMGIATLIGGVIGHGFLYLFSFAWKLPGWITSMVAVMLLERASIEQLRDYLPRRGTRALSTVNLVELAVFMLLTLVTLNFRFVEIHSAYGILVVVGSLQLYALLKMRIPAARVYLIAIAWAALSGVVYIGEFGLSIWFNHYDLSHTLMAVANFVFYRGAVELRNGRWTAAAVDHGRSRKALAQ
jgi:hypothetical protein